MIPLVHYRAGFRFQLADAFQCQTGIRGAACPGNHFVGLDDTGVLNIAEGYAWDGASGPVQQSPDIIRGSLVHDALYQLIRECGLDAAWRGVADELLRCMCVDDGMPEWQAGLVYLAVQTFGSLCVDPLSIRPVLVAPVPVTYPSTADWIAP